MKLWLLKKMRMYWIKRANEHAKDLAWAKERQHVLCKAIGNEKRKKEMVNQSK